MNPPDHDRAAIRALLDSLSLPQGAGAIPACDDLVGWLEGTLPADRVAAVEAALTQFPELRRALAAARLAREEVVPSAEMATLEGLVPAPVVAFPVTAKGRKWWALPLAAAAALALVGSAWSLGSGIAKQWRNVEDRELRTFLDRGLVKGGL